MKFNKKTKTLINNLISTLVAFSLIASVAQAQDKKVTRGDKKYDSKTVEKRLDNLHIEAYSIMENYPAMNYNYIYDNGMMVGVEVNGIPNDKEREKLEKLLVTLKNFEDEVTEVVEISEVYYVSETDPKPKMGYDDFYDKIYNNILYPEEAKNQGVEGTIYVKFVIDEWGEISRMKSKTNIDAQERYLEQLKEEAEKAVAATSGDWVPAKIGSESVSRWMMVPVQFKLETPAGMRRLYPFADSK